ncbi:MAG TPA: SpoIIE family protein phosphatase [Mizugakiibacter sp.]
MGWRTSIASRLALWTLLGSATVLVGSGAVLLGHTRRQLLQQTHREAAALADGAATAIQARLNRVVIATQLLAALAATRDGEQEGLLRDALAANDDLAGLAVVMAPSDGRPPPPAPFVSRRPDGALAERDLRGDDTHYWEQAWFLGGLACERGCWQRPFYSKSRRRWLINYSVAIRRGGRPVGLINADVTLDWLQGVLAGVHRPDGAQVFVLGGEGRFLAHDDPAAVGNAPPASVLEALAAHDGAPALLELAGTHGSPEPTWLYGAPIEGTHWALGLAVPEARIYAAVRRAFLADAGVGVLALLGIALIILVVTRRTLAPLGVLVDRAEHVARGELDFHLPAARRHDEVGRLTQAFDAMRRELALHIAQLTQAIRAQQRLSSELEIAQQIQTSLLPSEHYLDARCPTFELHAVLRPAREVGGDLYSYFMLDAQRFCVMVGDVSDKGIPAALFMARTITLAKALAPGTVAPEDLLQRLNRELCQGNDSCMFVSLLCGVLDVRDGTLALASAGHDPAILCGRAPAGLVEFESGPALGLDETAVYAGHALRLEPGDTLLMYTDGITEATDGTRRMFGMQRALQALVRPPPPDRANAFVERLLADVRDFVGEASQADDITVLALSWR